MRASLTALGIATATLISAGAIAQTAVPTNDPANNAATRAIDRTAGTNTSGAYPQQSDGTPANPKGTVVTREFDKAAGTNTSGAYPHQADGTKHNPKGTAVSRELDKTAGTNASGTNPAHSVTR